MRGITGVIKEAGKAYYRFRGSYPLKIRSERFHVDPHHPGFWRSVKKGKFEKMFFDILDAHLQKDDVYVDIGSWIGPTALFAARRCREVHCFEPDPVAYPYLVQNIALNKLSNIHAHPIALGATDGTVSMASHGGILGDSMTSMVNISDAKESVRVNCRRWDTWIKANQPGKISFIKIDIEGAEAEVIPDMQDWLAAEKPMLHLSVHGPYLPENRRMESLERIFGSLAFYGRCFDDQMQEVTIGVQLVKECKDAFRSWFFMP